MVQHKLVQEVAEKQFEDMAQTDGEKAAKAHIFEVLKKMKETEDTARGFKMTSTPSATMNPMPFFDLSPVTSSSPTSSFSTSNEESQETVQIDAFFDRIFFDKINTRALEAHFDVQLDTKSSDENFQVMIKGKESNVIECLKKLREIKSDCEEYGLDSTTDVSQLLEKEEERRGKYLDIEILMEANENDKKLLAHCYNDGNNSSSGEPAP
uniref:Uncharacterized protein n=1 Tax=Panagrolaimus sp. ES5 TaxID=591445 RepID=A0AC34GE17_9BILA